MDEGALQKDLQIDYMSDYFKAHKKTAPHVSFPVDADLTLGSIVTAVMKGGDLLKPLVGYIADAGIARWGPEVEDLLQPANRLGYKSDPSHALEESKAEDAQALISDITKDDEAFCDDIALRTFAIKSIVCMLLEQLVA